MSLRRALSAALFAAAACAGAGTPPAPASSVLPWIDDDYGRALSEARARRVPIFAELWAPWCHTCRSMRAFVFTDKALARYAKQFVWLSVDTEKAQNADFVKRYPIRAWPSFYVIDPGKESISTRWVGGATVGQLEKLFADVRASRADPVLARAAALYAAGDYAEAGKAYAQALSVLTPKSPQYAQAVEARLFCLQTTRARADCVALARDAMPHLRATASGANVAGSGLDCALELPAEAPGRAAAIAAFEGDVVAVLADRKLALAADDRSALYGSLFSAREEAKDEEGARKVASEWVAYLDGEAARAATPEQWTALDPNRLNAFEAAGEIEKAIPMLEKSEREFPQDYNPPARLALVYLRLKQYDAALGASDRALARVYGPRKLRVLAVRADIYKGMGDSAAERRTVSEALAYAEALPPGQRSDSAIAALKTQLDPAAGKP